MTNLTHIDNVEASESSSVITTCGVELANIIKVVVVEENVVNIICDEPFHLSWRLFLDMLMVLCCWLELPPRGLSGRQVSTYKLEKWRKSSSR